MTADPVLLFGPDGTAHLFGLGWNCSQSVAIDPRVNAPPSWTAVGSIWLSKSSDGGRSWSEPTIVYRNPGALEWPDKEWAALDAATGDIVVVWQGVSPLGNVLRASRSTDGGATWTAPEAVVAAGEEPAGTTFNPVVTFGSDRRIHIAYRACGNACIKVATSDAAGWAKSKVASTPFEQRPTESEKIRDVFPAIAYDASVDAVIVAWHHDAASEDSDVHYSVSRDAGRSWSDALTLNDNPQDGSDQFLPAIQARDGILRAAFYDRRTSGSREETRATFAMPNLTTGDLRNMAASPHVERWTGPDRPHRGEYLGLAIAGTRTALAWVHIEEGRREVRASVFQESPTDRSGAAAPDSSAAP